jgi:predicted nucleotidyltransferase
MVHQRIPSLEFLQEKRSQILAICAKHGAHNVRIFGSVARGEADAQSDIDFLVDYDLQHITPWFPAGLINELEELLGNRVDVVTETGLKERIKKQVLREVIAL